jgi:hypothetical protein
MHLAYVALLAFLIAEVHFIGDNVPQTRWITIQTAFNVPNTPTMFRGSFLAAEEENRASALNDGVKRRGCTDEATGSRFPGSFNPSSFVWKPWSWGS